MNFETNTISRICAALNVFREEWESIPCHVAQSFLTVAEPAAAGSPLSVEQFYQRVGLPRASARRDIAVLARGRPGRVGSKEPKARLLVRIETDPDDPRAQCRRILLTQQGRAFYKRLMTAMV